MRVAEPDLTSLASDSPRKKTKRKRSVSPATPGSDLAKHRTKRLSRAESRSPSVEIVQERFAAAKKNDGHKSTKARISDCEDKLAEHSTLIHDQGVKLSAQEELVAKQGTKTEKLSARVKAVEKKIPEDADIGTIQQSISELTERVNNRSTYIRTEIKKQWADVRSPFEQEQNRLNARLDSFRDDLAVQKVRIADCQKAVDEHIKKRKDHGIELSALEETVQKKSRIRRRQIEKLSDRVVGLEEKLSGHKTAAEGSDDGHMHGETAAQIDARLTKLTERIDELERKQATHHKNQESAMDEITKRLSAMEGSHTYFKKTSEISRTALEQQVKEHGDRLARQQRMTGSRNNQRANTRGQTCNSVQGPPHRAPPHDPHRPPSRLPPPANQQDHRRPPPWGPSRASPRAPSGQANHARIIGSRIDHTVGNKGGGNQGLE
jgi:chromosome segregation ATPase